MDVACCANVVLHLLCRVRRLKDRLAMTEARKAQNRMKFGEAEDEILVGDEVQGLGLIGGETGRIRQAMDSKKSR
jgi:U4/U6 small nuclear ribonucleoprotein PRP31